MMGDGAAVIPEDGMIYAPIDGEITVATMRNIAQNLGFALGYNSVGISIAAGAAVYRVVRQYANEIGPDVRKKPPQDETRPSKRVGKSVPRSPVSTSHLRRSAGRRGSGRRRSDAADQPAA